MALEKAKKNYLKKIPNKFGRRVVLYFGFQRESFFLREPKYQAENETARASLILGTNIS
jgi:hypothetical protein